jgi:hypothetical protein
MESGLPLQTLAHPPTTKEEKKIVGGFFSRIDYDSAEKPHLDFRSALINGAATNVVLPIKKI